MAMDLALKRTLVVISAILIVGGAIWIIVANKPKNPALVQNTTNNIALNPRIGEALPPDIQTPPVAQAPAPPPAPTPSPAPAPSPQGASKPHGGSAATPRPPQISLYKNSQLSFSVIMPANWVAGAAASGRPEVFFSHSAGGASLGSVEVYDNKSNETLDSLQQLFSKTPGVSGLERVIYRGHEGVGYFSTDTPGETFVFLINNKIFYVHNEEVLTRLNFI